MWYAWYGVGLGSVHSSVGLEGDSLRYTGVLVKNAGTPQGLAAAAGWLTKSRTLHIGT
jgi:hypothetical protein